MSKPTAATILGAVAIAIPAFTGGGGAIFALTNWVGGSISESEAKLTQQIGTARTDAQKATEKVAADLASIGALLVSIDKGLAEVAQSTRVLRDNLAANTERISTLEGRIFDVARSRADHAELSLPPITDVLKANPVTQARMEAADADPTNWITTSQNYSNQRYSRLDQITRSNVASLDVAFAVPLSAALEGAANRAVLRSTPLVDQGTLFASDGWGTVYAFDVRSGRKAEAIWTWRANMDRTTIPPIATGLGLFGGQVISVLADGRTVSIDRTTGETTWDQTLSPATLSGGRPGSAPLTVDGKVLVSQGSLGSSDRGWVAGLDFQTGKALWRTFTVPGPGEPGNETWKSDAWATGGAGVLEIGAYAPDSRTVIWGTGSPFPAATPEFRPGDNLYSNSVIAMDVDTGKLKWFFQYTPNDQWDYGGTNEQVLYDLTINGRTQKVTSTFSRNGAYYLIDRTNGQFLSAPQWATTLASTAAIDPKTGKPVEYVAGAPVQHYKAAPGKSAAGVECPPATARSSPSAFNPDKAVSYFAGHAGCPTTPVSQSELVAVNAKAGTVAAKVPLKWENQAGLLLTAGGLVVTGHPDGTVAAYDDITLDELWTFNTGVSIAAPPITYQVGGHQYLAILAGGPAKPAPGLEAMAAGAAIFVFALRN